MKKLLITTIILALIQFAKGQYGDQTPIVINGITCLLHYNGDNSVKHPLLIMIQGAGEYGSDPTKALKNGTGWAIFKNKWNPDSTLNPITHQYESFIVLSTLNVSQNVTPNFNTVDAIYTYMRNNYPVDTNCMAITGLSAGGGMSCNFGAHISNEGCCPIFYQFTTPKNILCAEISASAEILDSSAANPQPVQYLVADSIPLWGFSDSNDCQSHGLPIKHFVLKCQRLAPNIGYKYTYYDWKSVDGCGHGGWNQNIYDASKRYLVDGMMMNTYEWQLYKRRGAPVAPPTNTISVPTTGNSFCLTTQTGTSITATFTPTGTFAGDNIFTLQMSDASGSFANFQNIGTSSTTSISGTIPANTPTGNYKFRISSSNPTVTSAATSSKPINLAANKIVPTGNQTITIGQSTTTLTVRDSSTGATHKWYVDNVATTSTGTTFATSTLTLGNHTIYCQSTFSCATVNSNIVNITVNNTPSSKIYVTPNTTCYGWKGLHNYSAANPGDTIVLSRKFLGDTVCELSFIHLNGTPNKHITIISEDGMLRSAAAITLADDCHYVDINMGTQVGVTPTAGSISLGQYGSKPYNVNCGLEVFGAYKQGGGFEVYGKDSNITACNIYVHNRGGYQQFAGYGIIIKNDPNYFGCDFSYDYPNMFKNITCHDFVFENIDQDVIYLGYSHGYNEGYDPVVCNGVTYYPRPAILGNILMYNMYCKNSGRSFVQGGQLAGGNIVFHDMFAENAGHEINSAQGAFFSIGTPDSSVTIYNCGGNRSYRNAIYTFSYGTLNVYNCLFDSSGYCLDSTGTLRKLNGESNISLYPAINTYNTPLQFIIQNNKFGVNTQGSGGSSNANIRIDYGTSNANYATSGNIICNNIGEIIYKPFAVQYSGCAPLNTITTSNISPATFCVTSTVGANVTVTFSSTGTFNAGNVYTAYLSDAAGNFASQINIGSISSTANSGSISCIIPANLPTGSGYKIRVNSSNPAITGAASNNSITINLASNSIAPTAQQNILTNTDGIPLNVTETSTPTSRQWYANGVAISGQTGTAYTPNFASAGTYSVTCRSTYSCGVVTSNAVTIIVTAPVNPTISLKAITGSPFCVTATTGINFNVTFISVGTYNSGNVYTVQLSGKGGGWASPVTIGTFPSTANSGTIACTLPANTQTGIAYKIRIIASNPSVISNSRSNLTINLAANNVTPTSTQNIFTNTNGNTLTVTEQSTPTSRQWFSNGNAISGQTGTTYIPNFAIAGTYSVLVKSIFACGTITSNSVTFNVTNPPPPPPDSIFTGSISGSPFCVTASAGASVSVPFTSNGGLFNAGNIFTAQLSDANGSFASAVNIGTLSSTANSGTISATIPANTTTGTGYRIRVISSNPVVTGQNNGSDLIINLATNAITPTQPQTIFTNVDGNTLTVNEGSTPISRLWFVNGVSSGISTITYTPNFSSAGTYVIDCRSVFACGTITSNAVTVTVNIPPAPVINTGTISPLTYCVTSSVGASVSVPYLISGTFNAGNKFTAQLSDAIGSFDSYTEIGNVTSTTSGTISATIPAGTPTGTGYLIRVVSDNPVIIGDDNGDPITINLATNSIAPTNTQNIYTDSLGAPLTVTNQSAATVQWFYGITSGTYPTNTGVTASTYTPQFSSANTYYVVAKSTFAGCGTITSNEVRINVTDIPPPPPDTICSTIQIQHDTTFSKQFTRDTTVCRDSSVLEPRWFKILWFKLFIIGYDVVKIIPVCHDSSYVYDSIVTKVTPLHDTTICVITTGFNFNQSEQFKNDTSAKRDYFNEIVGIKNKYYLKQLNQPFLKCL